MKYFLIAFLFCFQASFGQTDSIVYIKEFGWTITLPPNFKVIDTATLNEESRKMNIHWIKKPTGENYHKLVLYIRKDIDHTFSINSIDSIHEALDSNFSKYNISKNGKATTSTEIYGGVKFYKFKEEMHPTPNWSYVLVVLRTPYNEKIFTIVYSYHDLESENDIENMLKTSKFDR